MICRLVNKGFLKNDADIACLLGFLLMGGRGEGGREGGREGGSSVLSVFTAISCGEILM